MSKIFWFKFSIFEFYNDIARINILQIEKRLRSLTEAEIKELIEIREKNSDLSIKIGTNILIGNINEANIDLKKLNSDDYATFMDYPIAIFLKGV